MLSRFVTQALNLSKAAFSKMKLCVASSEVRARMCKAGSASSDAVLMQQQQQQQQPPQSSQPVNEPTSSSAAAAAAAAADAAAALNRPVVIPRLALGSLAAYGRSNPENSASAGAVPPPSIDIILGRGSIAHPVNELRNIALGISAAVCDGAAVLEKQLALQESERLDTNRRKLAALSSVSAAVPRSAKAQLKSMRLLSEHERLQTSLRLLQNRWLRMRRRATRVPQLSSSG